MTDKKTQSGYTLLFAVLTASLVLGVAAFVVGVARKQYIISATARDSMFSFYNADSAVGCVTQSWFSTSTPTAKCAGQDLSFTFTEYSGSAATSWDGPKIFVNTTPNPDEFYGIDKKVWTTKSPNYNGGFGVYTDHADSNFAGCALTQIWVGTNSSGDLATVIESRGYSVACDDTTPGIVKPSTSPRNVERAIRVTQQ